MVRGREGGVEEESEEWLVWSEEGGRGGGVLEDVRCQQYSLCYN